MGRSFLEVVRSHWGVENQLHWRLDVVMNEDQQRNRSDNGPNNLAVLRHMALNVMQSDTSKGSFSYTSSAWTDRLDASFATNASAKSRSSARASGEKSCNTSAACSSVSTSLRPW